MLVGSAQVCGLFFGPCHHLIPYIGVLRHRQLQLCQLRTLQEQARGLPPSTFAQASNYLSTRFQGKTIDEVQRFVRDEMQRRGLPLPAATPVQP